MKKVVVMIVVTLAFLFTGSQAFASEPALPYSVSVVSPHNQLDKTKDYFDLLVVPGALHEVTVEVSNSEARPITLNVVPQNGSTSPTGSLDYTGSGKLLEDTMPYLFTDVCSPAQQVTLEAYEKQEATFTLAIPDESFEGKLLGAFQIYESFDEHAGVVIAPDDSGVEIHNRFMYIVGAVLQVAEWEPAPEFFLETVTTDTWNARFALHAELHQPNPTIVKHYSMQGNIVSLNTGKTVHSFEWTDFSMAPNSVFQFSETIDPDVLISGDYTMYLSVRGEGQTWDLENDFSVTPFQKFQTMSKTVDAANYAINAVLLGIFVALVIVITLRIIHRVVKKKGAE